jgi:hypothetical protein
LKSKKPNLHLEFEEENPKEIARHIAGDMGKYSKAQANYGIAHHSTFEAFDKRCGNCLHLLPERGGDERPNCGLVAGAINRSYTCRLFRRG